MAQSNLKPSKFALILAPPSWLATALEAAGQKGPYPRWITATVKAVIAIALLTGLATWAHEVRDKAELGRLAADASQLKQPVKTGSTRR